MAFRLGHYQSLHQLQKMKVFLVYTKDSFQKYCALVQVVGFYMSFTIESAIY